MGSIKKKIGIAVSAVGLCIVAATFVSVVSANSTDKVEIRLAHNQAAGSEIADSIAKFSEFVAEDDSMNLDVNIYASGVLGSEKEEIEMVQAGILDMAKVSSNTLGQFEDRYSIFAVPYLSGSLLHSNGKKSGSKRPVYVNRGSGLYCNWILCKRCKKLLFERRCSLR